LVHTSAKLKSNSTYRTTLTTMSDDELRVVATAALHSLVNSGKLSLPLSLMDLLAQVVAFKVPAGLLPNPSSKARFKLTDKSRFESVLQDLSHTWDQGTLSLSRENGRLTIMDISLDAGHFHQAFAGLEGHSGDALNPRKRKRVIDEDADSAAGDDDAEDSLEDIVSQRATTLGSLSKELREVYSLLQKSTARGRLLAEQA
jgi:mRNA (2'-O-methyladenosine-N6-)-methyltransferase